MIQTSDLWKEITSTDKYSVRWKASIAGVEYNDSDMFSIGLKFPIFSSFSVGNVCSAQLIISVIEKSDIPKMAEIIPSLQVVLGGESSEWVERGRFYIDERESGQFGSLFITAYDSALLSEVGFLEPGEEIGYEWPATPKQVMGTIMSKLGVELDSRTVLSEDHIVQFTDTEISCRTMASHVAAAHAGNWVVTNEGKWLLVTFDMMKDVLQVGNNASSLIRNRLQSPITQVTIIAGQSESGEDLVYVSGNTENGINLDVSLPWGTQGIADSILAKLSSVSYRPFSASNAILDPAFELGDLVSIGGFESILCDVSLKSSGLSDISAPGEDDIESEIPYQSGEISDLSRRIKTVASSLIISSNQIKAEITDVKEQVSQVSGTVTSVQENLEEFSSTVSSSLDGLQAQIDGQIQTWFYNELPTNDNAPANEWTTEADKINHLGDLYYVVDNDVSGGQAYRWAIVEGEYKWVLIEDVEVAKALADAAKAQDTADGKRRVFVSQPFPPYDVGDLWAQGESGDLMRCNVARASGYYVESDWGKASDYTNDDALNEFVDGEYTGTKTEISERLSQLEVTTESISAEVSSATESVAELESMVNGQAATITSYDERIARLELTDGEIAASVEEVRKEVQSSVDSVESEVTELSKRVDLSLTSEQVEIQIQTAINGIDSITTSTGFRFDDEGLFITQSQSSTITTIDSAGFLVTDLSGNPVLTARGNSVEAKDLSATTYLNIGGRSRIENYGTDRSALYWIGG